MPCLHCELPNLLHDSMPPDAEMVNLIEQAFLEGQIEGEALLAYQWLSAESARFRAKRYPDCYPKRKRAD